MSIFFEQIDVASVNERAKDSLSDHLGIVFTEVGEDFLKAKMPVSEKTLQPMGIMHGGASAALAETVASAAGNFCVDQSKFLCVGLEININHLKPVKKGFVTAVARPFHLGRKTQCWEIKIFNDEEKLNAISRLTLAVVERSKIIK
jgi:1,4-dihydroxy-2-naphthoyl-CoA hydrolase